MNSRVDPFAPRAEKKRSVPFAFVLDALAALAPSTRPMFGCTAVYLDERIVFVLREKHSADDGVWVAYEPEFEAELRTLFPALEPIDVLGNARGWRKLSAKHPAFEENVLRACNLLCSGDARLGKVPAARKPRATRAPSAASHKRSKKKK